MTTSTYDFIAFQARLQPGGLAVVGREGVVRYGELLRDIDALAALLFGRGAAAWRLAGIELGTTYLHLVTILALDRLNVPSFSVTPQFASTKAWLSRQGGDAGTISMNPAPGGHGGPWVMIEPGWRDQPVPAAHGERIRALPSPAETILQIALSSGTTGLPKAVPVTRIVQLTKMQEAARMLCLSDRARVLACVIDARSAAFMATLAVGGIIVIADWDEDIADTIARFSVTLINVTPVLVDHLIEIARRSGARYPSLQGLFVGGGHLPRRTAREALTLLTPRVFCAYGAMEMGWIACCHVRALEDQPEAVGYVVPGCDLEVLDDEGRPLPAGTAGAVRIRKPQMVQGYLDDPEATAHHFRNGWFHPSDVAVLEPTGLVRLLGRTDEVINSHGFKFGPAKIEEVFRSQAGVRDVAAFAAPAIGGGDEPWVAFVCDPPADPRELLRIGMRELGAYAPMKHLRLDTLPRSENGKVLRLALRDMVVRQRADRLESA